MIKRCRRSEGNADVDACEGKTFTAEDDEGAPTEGPICSVCSLRLVFFIPMPFFGFKLPPPKNLH